LDAVARHPKGSGHRIQFGGILQQPEQLRKIPDTLLSGEISLIAAEDAIALQYDWWRRTRKALPV